MELCASLWVGLVVCWFYEKTVVSKGGMVMMVTTTRKKRSFSFVRFQLGRKHHGTVPYVEDVLLVRFSQRSH